MYKQVCALVQLEAGNNLVLPLVALVFSNESAGSDCGNRIRYFIQRHVELQYA